MARRIDGDTAIAVVGLACYLAGSSALVGLLGDWTGWFETPGAPSALAFLAPVALLTAAGACRRKAGPELYATRLKLLTLTAALLLTLTAVVPYLLISSYGLAVGLLLSLIPAAAVCWGMAGRAAELWLRAPLDKLPNPEVGEVWWAEVPFEDSRQSKDRPCLVVGGKGRRREVMMFTSQNKHGRPGYALAPAGMWRGSRRDSFLKTNRRIPLRVEKFRKFEVEAPEQLLAIVHASSN